MSDMVKKDKFSHDIIAYDYALYSNCEHAWRDAWRATDD